jgi:C1A family cysteine protease
MLAVGYSDQSKAFIVRNSWGTVWVNKTFFFREVFSIIFILGR